MKPMVVFSTVLTLLGAASASAADFVGFKSPGPGMHFTEGLPIVVFADLFDDTNGFGYVVGGVGWPKLELWIDDQRWTDDATGTTTVSGASMFDSNGNPDPVDFHRFVASGVAAGPHRFVARGLFSQDGSHVSTTDGAPLIITVDPWPASKTVVDVSSDMTLDSLDWENVAVRGNGHAVTVNGPVVIKNSLVTGLGSLDAPGISGSASSIDIENSIFEATGALDLELDGAGDGVVRNNEFRANNLIRFVASDPDASPVIRLSGNDAKPKVFQGNRVGAGRVVFDGVSSWLVGGDTDEQGNVLMGPRCSLAFVNGVSHVTVRGNYDHHNYRGGWSQGFNLTFSCRECGRAGGDGVLVEHNFIRGGSWPVQDLVGEFRYNVVYGYGHDWLRSAVDGASIHHNLFTAEGKGDLNEGIWSYEGETGLQIYNNTFDGGGMTGDFSGPMVRISGSSRVTSLRSNLFTYSLGGPEIAGDDGAFLYADYNAFYSPDDPTGDNYAIAFAPARTEGSAGFAGHDVSGTGALGVLDGRLASTPFAGERILPLEAIVDEAAVWQGTQKLSAILAAFRTRYTPAPASPVIDAGDPQDDDAHGRRADIGAIDRDGHDQDKLGKFGAAPAETAPPSVSLTAPAPDAMLSGVADLEATAQDDPGGSGVVLVQFLVDGNTVGQTATSPYSLMLDLAIFSNGPHVFAAKAWDAAGNFAVSAPVTAQIEGNVGPVLDGGSGSGTGGGSAGITDGSSGAGSGGSSGSASGGWSGVAGGASAGSGRQPSDASPAGDGPATHTGCSCSAARDRSAPSAPAALGPALGGLLLVRPRRRRRRSVRSG